MKSLPNDAALPRRRPCTHRAALTAILLGISLLSTLDRASAGLTNGSFESGYSGLTPGGNQSLAGSAPYLATQGTKLVVFNNGNSTPNGTLSQSFATTPGSSYTLRFDMGVLAYNNSEQRLQVDLAGTSALVSRTFVLSRNSSTPLRWLEQNVSFTADSATTVLTFRDRSAISANLDLLLDNVRLDSPVTRTLTVASSGFPQVTIAVSPADEEGNTYGTTTFSLRYPDGRLVNLAAPPSFGGMYPDKSISYHFEKWLKNGVQFATTPDVGVTIDGNTALTAVYVQNPPVIGTQPASAFAAIGGSATFQVAAGGGITGYQWRFNGSAIPGATGPSHTIASVQNSDVGSYDVVISNAGGSVTSQPASLTLVATSLVNGSFESGYDGWTVVGNQEIQSSTPYTPTDGSQLVSFNSVNSTPNGILSQTFATSPGTSYLVTFDMGFLAYNRNEQALRVVADGSFNLLDREFTIKSIGGETLRWITQRVEFTADSQATTLSFLDASATSFSVDLLLDHVSVIEDPLGFSLIPSGSFQMGDTPRTVQLDAFYMAKYEVTAELWTDVWSWATGRGYTDMPRRSGKGTNHPVQTVSWKDAVKWCNARSEMEGLTPCYRVSGSVYRAGYNTPDCTWTANGYRLPTEAEWEKATRGGFAGLRFPWGDTISHSNANYVANTLPYDVSPVKGYHPLYQTGGFPYTSPIGSFPANGYGLYDVAGNVFEMCWDFSAEYDPAALLNPKGPETGFTRIVRGGSWGDLYYCPNAARSSFGPDNSHYSVGFRLAKNATP